MSRAHWLFAWGCLVCVTAFGIVCILNGHAADFLAVAALGMFFGLFALMVVNS